MAQSRRVVAELGRPETPDETAARKAESSRVYRSSQTTRNLVAALLATLAVVVIIVFAVPRGTPPDTGPIDVAAAAERVSTADGRLAIAPAAPDEWAATRAAIDADGAVRTWTVVFAPTREEIPGFVRVAQGFDADAAWPARVFGGAAPTDSVTIDGVVWDRYELDPEDSGNITAALATTAGADTVLVYGTADDADLEHVAASVAGQLEELAEAP